VAGNGADMTDVPKVDVVHWCCAFGTVVADAAITKGVWPLHVERANSASSMVGGNAVLAKNVTRVLMVDRFVNAMGVVAVARR
jgi:hypothetical protein